ncbi:MAG: DsbA family protein [Deltaproteobacteria bacterium]|nr:DsbA family protein [Deltaproteobacteria bacterium]
MADTGQLLYFADPMCSWCWGFAPVINRIAAALDDTLPVQVVLGGLAPGATEPLSAPTKIEFRHYWEEVGRKTGQPFDFGFFERDAFVYDTEPACRAVATVRRLNPGVTLRYLTRLHEAFHAEGANVTDPWVLRALAAEVGVDGDEFATCVDQVETHEVTRADFALSRELGVRGFPTLLLIGAEQPCVVTQGYKTYDEVTASLSDMFDDG